MVEVDSQHWLDNMVLPHLRAVLSEPSLEDSDRWLLGLAIMAGCFAVYARHGVLVARTGMAAADTSPSGLYDLLLRIYRSCQTETAGVVLQ